MKQTHRVVSNVSIVRIEVEEKEKEEARQNVRRVSRSLDPDHDHTPPNSSVIIANALDNDHAHDYELT